MLRLSSLFQRAINSYRRKRLPRKRPLSYEVMECRNLLSVTSLVKEGALVIQGTAEDDLVEVRQLGTEIWVQHTTRAEGKLLSGGIDRFKVDGIESIVVKAGAGNDQIRAVYPAPRLPIILYGDEGDDQLVTVQAKTVLIGGDGNDSLLARNGHGIADYGSSPHGVYVDLDSRMATADGFGTQDSVLGVSDINGSNFDDVLLGDFRTNVLDGRDGNDLLHGRKRPDFLNNVGNPFSSLVAENSVSAYSANDLLLGGKGNDTLVGASGNDYLTGGEGDDYLHGGGGKDDLHGGEGNDELRGGLDLDTLAGDLGENALYQEDTDDAGFGLLVGSPYAHNLDILSDGSEWNFQELSQLYQALDYLVDVTGSERILHDSTLPSSKIQIIKVDSFEEDDVLGLNRSSVDLPQGTYCARTVLGVCVEEYVLKRSDIPRRILIKDWDETDAWEVDEAIKTIVHEFAHNWDESHELQAAGIAGSIVQDFRNISGWTESDPEDSSYEKSDDDDDWWYFKNIAFARSYGKTNPLEDMATMWEAYYETYTTDGPFGISGGFVGIPPYDGKFLPISDLYAALSSK